MVAVIHGTHDTDQSLGSRLSEAGIHMEPLGADSQIFQRIRSMSIVAFFDCTDVDVDVDVDVNVDVDVDVDGDVDRIFIVLFLPERSLFNEIPRVRLE